MSANDTQPTLPLGPVVPPRPPLPASAPKRKKKRTGLKWLIALLVVVGVLVVLWLIAEAIARYQVEKIVREQVIVGLELPESHPVEVDVPGAILPQLIAGSLNEIAVASENVPFGPFSADVSGEAFGVAVRGEPVMDAANAVVVMNDLSVRELMATVEGFPVDTVSLDGEFVAMSFDLNLLVTTFTVGVAAQVSADEGELVLTPARIDLGGVELTADELRHQFGIASRLVLRDWNVCIAEYLPAGLDVTNVRVQDSHVFAEVAVNGRIAVDAALLEPGHCG